VFAERYLHREEENVGQRSGAIRMKAIIVLELRYVGLVLPYSATLQV